MMKNTFVYFVMFLLHNSKGIKLSTQINVLFVTEDHNAIAEKAFYVATEYVKRNPSLGLAVNPVVVAGNRTNAKGFLEAVCSKYNEMLSSRKYPHLVLDFTMAGVGSEAVKSFTAALGLPTISGSFRQSGDLRQWRALSVNETKFLLQVMPPADVLTECVRAIITKQDITNAAILFDDNFVGQKQNNNSLFIPVRHVFVPVEGLRKEDIKKKLRILRNTYFATIFVLGSLKTIRSVLDAAEDNQYFGRKTSWFVLSLEKGDISCDCKDARIVYVRSIPDAKSRDRLENIKATYNMNHQPEITSAFYFDLSLTAFLTVKTLCDSGQWENVTSYIKCADYNGKNTPKMNLDLRTAFRNMVKETPTLAHFFIPQYGEINGHSYMEFNTELVAVTIKDGKPIENNIVGSWKAGLSNNILITDPASINNYSAEVVHRILCVEEYPFIVRDDKSPKGFRGYCIELIEEIRKIIKFDYEITVVPDGKFGNMDEDGNWDGIVKELMEKRADIGLGSISVTTKRLCVIDFTISYYDLSGVTILMKIPRAKNTIFLFLSVLEFEVWISLLFAFSFTSLLMWVFDKWSPYSFQNNRGKYNGGEEQRDFTLKECLWFCTTSLTPQGGGETPKNLSGRLLAATWWLFGFFIMASYTANIATFLTVSRMEKPIDSLDDLSKQYKIQYATVNGTTDMEYFKHMADIEERFDQIWKKMTVVDSLSRIERAKLAVWDYPVSSKYSKIWQAMEEAGMPNTIEEAIGRVRNSKSSSEGFAWIGDSLSMSYLVKTNCDLQMVGEEFFRKPHAIALQLGSPLKRLFDNAITQLQSKHILQKLNTKWWKTNPEFKKCTSVADQFDGISIQNMGGIFLLLLLGIGLSSIIILVEYWFYGRRKIAKGLTQVRPRKTVHPSTQEHRVFTTKAIFGGQNVSH